MNEQIKNYIDSQRKSGISDAQIKTILMSQGGWNESDLNIYFSQTNFSDQNQLLSMPQKDSNDILYSQIKKNFRSVLIFFCILTLFSISMLLPQSLQIYNPLTTLIAFISGILMIVIAPLSAIFPFAGFAGLILPLFLFIALIIFIKRKYFNTYSLSKKLGIKKIDTLEWKKARKQIVVSYILCLLFLVAFIILLIKIAFLFRFMGK